ncbi:MAG: extracellular solute-binding protein [Fidelibacterota bacterium]
MKKYSIIVIFLVLSFLSIFCVKRKEGVVEKGEKKITLRVVVPPWWEINLVGEPGIFSTQILESYRENHPNVNLTGDTEGRTKYLLQGRQGTLPDVITLDGFWIPEFASIGYTVPLDRFIPEELKNDYYEPFLVRYRSKIHGIIGETAFNAMLWYRKDLFEEEGLDHPPRDWNELREYARMLTKIGPNGKVIRYGLALPGARSEHTSVVLLGFYWQGGEEFVNQSNIPIYNNRVSNDLFNLFEEMCRIDKSIPPETVNMLYEDVEKLFSADKAAMMLHGSWLSVTINKKAPHLEGKIGLAPLPSYPATGKTAVNAGGWGISITTKDTSKFPAAWDFIYINVGNPGFHLKRIIELGSIPVRKSMQNDPHFTQDEWGRTIMELLPFARTRPPVEIYPDASLAWTRAFQEVLMGEKSAEDALNDAVAWTREIAVEKGYIK